MAVLFCGANAHAALSVSLDINQSGDASSGTSTSASSWIEDITPLVTLAADGSFSMLSGVTAPGQYLQNGIFSTAAPSISTHPDYWAWTPANGNTAGYWNWHSAETVGGSILATTTGSDPWRTSVNLNNTLGHKAQDIDYDYSARNNSAATQTYTFSVIEDIDPAMANPTTVFNQFTARFTNKSNNFLFNPTSGSGAQHFLLSANGTDWVDAGVDVGGSYSNPVNLNPTEAKSGVGPTGGPWKFMKLSTSFTLSGKDSAALVGYGSIASAVPEPESYAMLLAGLGLLGFAARRCQRG
jgi:hypothetical protein